MNNDTPSDRVLKSDASTDRAVRLEPVYEPLNRRGRRHLAAEIRRSERRELRSLIREEVAELTGR